MIIYRRTIAEKMLINLFYILMFPLLLIWNILKSFYISFKKLITLIRENNETMWY